MKIAVNENKRHDKLADIFQDDVRN